MHPFAPQMTGRPASELPIDKLKVPAGFKVEVWIDGIPEARSLALGDKGTVFVSNRLAKNVYAVVDRGGKREVKTILKGLNAPNGIAFSKGTLYVAERNRITRYDGIEDKLDNPPEGKVVVDNLDPTNQPGHFWKFLALGPDGKLYFNIGVAAEHHHADLHAGGDHARRPDVRRAGELCPGRAQLGRFRLASEDQAIVVYRAWPRLDQR